MEIAFDYRVVEKARTLQSSILKLTSLEIKPLQASSSLPSHPLSPLLRMYCVRSKERL